MKLKKVTYNGLTVYVGDWEWIDIGDSDEPNRKMFVFSTYADKEGKYGINVEFEDDTDTETFQDLCADAAHQLYKKDWTF